MRADALSLDNVLKERQQWVVPVYQRHYEWLISEDKQIPKLWEDLRSKALDGLEGNTPYPHYFGAIIFAEPRNQAFGTVRNRYLVDGQQRITTFQLILTAIREASKALGDENLPNIVNSFLFNEKSPAMERPDQEIFKLWPSAFDRNLYKNIVSNSRDQLRELEQKSFYKNGNLNNSRAPNMLRAYWWILQKIDSFVKERAEEGNSSDEVFNAILSGFLNGFQIVLIQLDEDDDAQEIFASLNGLNQPLTPFDLVRNDVFHRARRDGEDIEALFDSKWKVFEDQFWTHEVKQGRTKRARADHLLTHAVIAETAREVNAGKIAAEYQKFARNRQFSSPFEELDTLIGHASTYRAMEEDESHITRRIAFVLRTWDMSVFHPLVFWISAQSLNQDEMHSMFCFLEGYIVRRDFCNLTTKNYNKVAIGAIKSLRESCASRDELSTYFHGLTGDAARLPSDGDVLQGIQQQGIYENLPPPRLKLILSSLEKGLRTKFDETTVLPDNLQIEHVMPRCWSEHWSLPSGEYAPMESPWDAMHAGHDISEEMRAEMGARQGHIHTLGNLTLVTPSANQSMGKNNWAGKKQRLKGSLLALNRPISDKEVWDESKIDQRAQDLGKLAIEIWPG